VEKNRTALDALLDQGVTVTWFDHHNPGELPDHPGFRAHIDTAADTCTSLIVDRHLAGRQRAWAVVAAFGDNLADSARLAAQPLNLDHDRLASLQALGECLNYNGYGETLEDLHYHPAELYRSLAGYTDPFAYLAESPVFQVLRRGYQEDMALAAAVGPREVHPGGALYLLPDAPWARRVSGVQANALANRHPDRAHALLTRSPQGHYVVSVRAPIAHRSGADTVCMQFETGGGRKAAAGINRLPEERLDDFARAFFAQYP